MSEFALFIRCPVSRDQRPFYEYLKRKESVQLGSVALNQFKYTNRFFFSLLSLFTLFSPITYVTISLSCYPVQCILINLLLSLFGLAFIYTYLYTTWFYVKRRLLKAKISYEESGWYDGKIWIKPPSILKHERLLCYYQVVPLLKRIQNTLQIIFLSIGVILLTLFFLSY